ncbi:hypothetical protein BGZ94_010347 [Podila epigama]|nr:hypothetical protein BGZ94_010347 [Podila epigama]
MSQQVLQTPEMVLHIGWFVPLWFSNRFRPKDLISCITVCRLWRDLLTPLLWMVYDDSLFRVMNIPEMTAHDNSQHIRYIRLFGLIRREIPRVSQLRGLHLGAFDSWHRDVVYLLQTNPALVSLNVTQLSFSKSGLVAITPALLKMTALRHLCLGGECRLKPDILRSILDNNQGLESLSLNVHYDTVLDFDDWSLYIGIKNLCVRFHPARPTWLFSLLQHCPNVETLYILEFCWDLRHRKSNIVWLSKILHEHCPKVKGLRFWESGSSTLSMEYYLTFIQATNNLVQIEMSMGDFSTVICDALLRGSAHSLEVLHLYIHGRSTAAESFVSAGRILSSCPKLEHLLLVIDGHPGYSEATDKALFARPWIGSNLKTFTLKPKFYESYTDSASCQHETIEDACSIEIAYEAEIQKQGWRNLNPRYEFPHVSWTRRQHRAALLTAVSALQHVNTVDLGFCRFEHVERPSKPFSFQSFD